MKRNFITVLLVLFAATSLVAQQPISFTQKQSIPVHTATGTLPSPWVGGLNTPQFSTIDLNKDGVQDLFAFDRILQKTFTWLAVKENGTWQYEYSPAYEMLFPETLHDWVLLRDYNCDGLKDIFTSDPLGIRVYKQIAGESGKPSFVLEKEYLTYGSGVNMQMTSADVPAITDVDGDGDLDILLSEFSRGQNLEYFQNMQTERGLPCGNLTFILNTGWWGNITECMGCNNYVFGASCRVAGPAHSGHDGTSLLLLDMDGDGDKDLLSGGVECNELVLMENKGNARQARMESMQLVFPTNTRQASFQKFPAAFYEDVTFDGVPDLLVAPGTGHSNGDSEARKSIWLYKNKGETDKPSFEFVQDNFLQEQMIDLGEGAYTAFADLDGDGDLDMLIGNNGTLQNGTFKATIAQYLNTGTASEPAFTFVTDDFLGLKAMNLLALKPAFADMNGDGAKDLLLTYRQRQAGTNKVVYLPNTASKGAGMAFNWGSQQAIKSMDDGDSPAFYDVDEDGDLDMLVGKANGTLHLYLNQGTAASPNYTLTHATLGGISPDFGKRNLYPAVADLDGNEVPDLITVDESGVLNVYTDFSEKLNQDFSANAELLTDELTDKVHKTRLGKSQSVTPVAFGDKGRLNLFVGSLGGGVVMLEQATGNSSQPDSHTASLKVTVYPNPAAKGVQNGINVSASEAITFIVYDALGKKVYSSPSTFRRRHRIESAWLRAGVYFLRAVSKSGQRKTTKLVIL